MRDCSLIFCSNGEKNSKGEVLVEYLKTADWFPLEVVFIDDMLYFVESMVEPLNKLGINYTGIHYTGFKPDFVDEKEFSKEWENLNKESYQILQKKLLVDMNIKEKFLKKLKDLDQLNLPKDQYIIWGSGSLAIRNLREAKDIDLIVSKPLWMQLCKTYKPQGLKKNCLKIKNIEIWNDCLNLTDKIDEMIKNKDLIEGYPFMKLSYMLQWKNFLKRDKDLKDIRLIEDYLYEK